MLVLKIPFDLSPDTGHKSSRFSETLLEKSLKFILSRQNNTVTFNLNLVLLLVKVISKKQSYKKNALRAHGIGHVEIIPVLLTKIIALYIKAIIV